MVGELRQAQRPIEPQAQRPQVKQPVEPQDQSLRQTRSLRQAQ